MKCLNVVIFGIALTASLSLSAREPDTAIVKKKLSPWQPLEITQNGDQLTAVLPSADIDSEAYRLIISTGVCPPAWSKSGPRNYLSGIKQINVINKFKSTGYSFENPLKVCKEMEVLMDKPASALLLENTHIYKNR